MEWKEDSTSMQGDKMTTEASDLVNIISYHIISSEQQQPKPRTIQKLKKRKGKKKKRITSVKRSFIHHQRSFQDNRWNKRKERKRKQIKRNQ